MSEPDGLPAPRRLWAMVTMGLALTMAVLDGSIANVALPVIALDLGISPSDSVWVVNAYQLIVVMSLLPLASLGEIVGYRRVYVAGIALFTLASLICALSTSLEMLAIARAVQGFGAAGLMSVNTALLRYIWPQRSFGRGLGINALVVSVSAAAGPTVAAAILAVADWPWVFAVNVPFGILTILAAGTLPTNPKGNFRFDLPSALLSAATFGLAITGIQALSHESDPALVLPLFAGAVLAGWLLVRRQLKRPAPLLPVDLLRIPLFALSICTSVCSFLAQMLAFVALPFYLHDALGRSPVETGLLMSPWPLASGVMAPISGRLADRYPAGLLSSLGLAMLAVGLAALALLPEAPTNLQIAWPMVLCGLGFGLFQSPNNRTIIGAAPIKRSGSASGMLGTARLLGQSTGAAVAALALSMFAPSTATAATVALGGAAGFSILAAIISVLRLRTGTATPKPPDKA